MDYEKEISFGAFDSELMHQEIFIPEGFEATIDGDKIILTRTESNDERIRKAIIDIIKSQKEQQCHIDSTIYDEMLAWLEKQGTSYTKKDVDDAFVEGMALAKNELEKQGEKKSSDEVLKIRQELYQSGYNDGYKHGCEDTKKQGEQKNDWSEDDEVKLQTCIDCLQAESLMGKVDTVMTNWLKSLKQRIGWKPSDEQMHYLNWIANIKLGDSVVEQEVSKHLNVLYDELKKLKGE